MSWTAAADDFRRAGADQNRRRRGVRWNPRADDFFGSREQRCRTIRADAQQTSLTSFRGGGYRI
jgi:hypothetical protein